jgi:DNA (cytosine-5)-methyltransferase 1
MVELNLVDLFAAPGGMSLGFEMAGYNCSAALDHYEDGCSTLSHNFPSAVVINEDIHKVTGKRILDEAGLSRGEVDVVIGGPPCQGFSNVGRVKIASLVKKGIWNLSNGEPHLIDDPRNLLYREFARIVVELAPKFFLMENVSGMVSYKDGQLIGDIEKELTGAGYTVDHKILDAVNFGVPQHRRRVFFLGNKLGIPNSFPEDRGNGNDRSSPDKFVDVWSSIGDLPSLKQEDGSEEMEYNKPALHPYQQWARAGSRMVFNHVARPHSQRDLVTFGHMRPGDKWKDLPERIKESYGYRDDIFNDKFKRLWKNRPAWTVTAHLCKDGYVYIHPTQSRTITVREAARLQSFPDRFVFKGSRSSQFKQVGNAVPPLLAKAIALEIKEAMVPRHPSLSVMA